MRLVGMVAALVMLAGVGAGCSDDEASSGPVTVTVTVANGRTEPNGDTVKVARGETVSLQVVSDIDDEIHVHSTPDRSFPVTAGERLEETFSFEQTGTYEMESHRLDKLIVKFEVR